MIRLKFNGFAFGSLGMVMAVAVLGGCGFGNFAPDYDFQVPIPGRPAVPPQTEPDLDEISSFGPAVPMRAE